MGTDYQDVKTGHQAFDNIITSLEILHNYIQEHEDEATFAILIGGAKVDNNYHLCNSFTGDLRNPKIFKAAIQSITNTMRESDLFTKLIIAAYHNYKSEGNIKVVKLTVDSPFDALMLLKKLINQENNVPDLDDLPLELLQALVDSLPPDIAKGFYEKELCDDPDCPICAIKQRLRTKQNVNDLSDLSDLFRRFNNDNLN